ncbi:MAG: hypothetical protein U0411_13915 [Thermodesulfovibrionales bacterium]
MNRLDVSAECPSCGAPLDFKEGSNAVQCRYCGSNLLVTGRKQVLSYYVEPKADRHRGAAAVLTARKGREEDSCHIAGMRLCFIPYYRLSGHDLRWERAAEGDEAEGADFPADRYLEKNFLACSLEGRGIYSLGVRPSALALRLFHEETLAAAGKVVAADVSVEAALARGMKTELPENLLYRAVIGRILSLVYFPFWIVELECGGKRSLSLMDAVTGTVIPSDAPLSLYEVLDRTAAETHHRTAGFRPLVCPNCGGDLPVKPDDVVFFCAACVRAWQIYGSDFREVPYRFAEARDSAAEGGAATYLPVWLPFWVLRAEQGEGPHRFFLPAFRYRGLKALSDLATALTRMQPEYTVSEHTDSGVRSGISYGCYYDQEDAELLALFVHGGMKAREHAGATEKGGELALSGAELVWLPFSTKGPDLVDPFTGRALSKNALL